MNHPYEERYQAEPFIGTPAQGGFTEDETAGNGELFLYHAVHIIDEGTNKGQARLALGGDRVDGSFVSFDGGEAGSALIIYSFRQKGMRFRSGSNRSLPLGSKIIGAVRSGATPHAGYVNAYFPETGGDDAFNDITTTVLNGLDGAVSPADRLDFLDLLAIAIGDLIVASQQARGFVRGPEGERHRPLSRRSEADVIVEFGFE